MKRVERVCSCLHLHCACSKGKRNVDSVEGCRHAYVPSQQLLRLCTIQHAGTEFIPA